METMDHLNDYYGQYDEDGRLTRNRRGELEYLTTMGYIQAVSYTHLDVYKRQAPKSAAAGAFSPRVS